MQAGNVRLKGELAQQEGQSADECESAATMYCYIHLVAAIDAILAPANAPYITAP